MTDVITVVEGLDFIVSLAAGHVHPEDIDAAREAAESARLRAGYLGSTVVMALVGGTGSGKSSLLNAIVGEEVAPTSALRPHTTDPLAVIEAGGDPALREMLGRLGVTRILTQDELPGFALLDMTDIDSVEPEHRSRVEELLPEVDVVLWVLDPVKYADPAVHQELIAPLAGAADRLVFVLNKIDELDAGDVDRVSADLAARLEADGIPAPVVFEIAAAPRVGEALGMDPLVAHLSARLDEKRIHIGKVVDDARGAARSIAAAAGIVKGGGLDFEERWTEVRSAIADEVAAGLGPASLEEGLRLLEGLILRLAADAGGVFGIRLRQAFDTRLIEEELVGAFDMARGESDPQAAIDSELQRRLGAPLRELLWERASLAAVVAGLSVDATMVDHDLGRLGA